MAYQEVPDDIDINVFKRSKTVLDIAGDSMQANCMFFWRQQGIINTEAYERLKDSDFTVIMGLCIKLAHAILL